MNAGINSWATTRLPPHAPGLSVGLFGGSFNPAHEGHRSASLLAFRRLGLDRVWWLVSPGNPLKDHRVLAPLEARIAAARKVARHPRVAVTGIEALIGTRYTYETIAYLKRRCPGVRFVWIMGGDNLVTFHHWKRWRDIAALVPIAIIDRPGSTLKASRSPAGIALAPYRRSETQGILLPDATPPAFIYLHGPRSSLSSTVLRETASKIGVVPT
jgi:nicotinate-nucleotide adenylyltransferase